ncbi:MAG TPA: pyridoxal-dependent decarboxylase [Actinomycetota bacterium]|nr:pyridoxal-dependent decarboxylase [Actinomycetota bacterium]
MTDRPRPVRDLDWSASEAAPLRDAAVDVWERLISDITRLPIARDWAPGEVASRVRLDVPREPLPVEQLRAHLEDVAFETSVYPGHPRFMGYITGAGTVPGALGDLVAAALNQNVGGWRLSPAATEIEHHLTTWFARRFGLPASAGGIIVSGGSMANFTCLKVARDTRAEWDVRAMGVPAGPPLAIYASTETHAVVRRAADALGLGMDAVRCLPVDDVFRLRIEPLRAAIKADRAAGIRPLAVVASAGTVATGAIDPLEQIADVCAREGVWFHVDASYGGPACFTDELRPQFAGIERADSIAFDPHKWMYTPHSGGCAVLRDFSLAKQSFHVDASYTVEDRERTASTFDFGSHGMQWSRGFAALKIWLSLLAHGTDAYERRIAHDAELARYMGARVEARTNLELVTPVSLSICCFRYVPSGLPLSGDAREHYLDELNARTMTEVQLDGRAYCSNAMIGERFVLRACIVNFRTEAEDVDALLDVVCEIGGRVDAAMRPRAARLPVAVRG